MELKMSQGIKTNGKGVITNLRGTENPSQEHGRIKKKGRVTYVLTEVRWGC